jgi:hypothetical protein
MKNEKLRIIRKFGFVVMETMRHFAVGVDEDIDPYEYIFNYPYFFIFIFYFLFKFKSHIKPK